MDARPTNLTPPALALARALLMANSFVKRGGLWVLSQAVLLLAVVVGGLLWHGQWQAPGLRVLGILLLILAGVCGLCGFLALGRNLTPYPEPTSKAHLIEKGIYRLVRHPLYLAGGLAALGWALDRASWPALIIATVLAVFLDRKARREERALRAKFSDYPDYERRVRRFIPGLY